LSPPIADVPGETILIGSGPEFAPEVSPDPLFFLIHTFTQASLLPIAPFPQ